MGSIKVVVRRMTVNPSILAVLSFYGGKSDTQSFKDALEFLLIFFNALGIKNNNCL